jgi:hypothetical protein
VLARFAWLFVLGGAAILHAAPPALPALDPGDVEGAGDGDGASDDTAATRRAVALLPLVPQGSLSSTQARGVTAQVRGALERLAGEGAVKLLPATKADDKVLRRCAAADACFDDVARERGADRLAHGTVAASDAGLVVSVVVGLDHRVVTTTLAGDDDDDARLDRFVREAFAEDTLRGALVVEGQPADEVFLDGRRRGALGSDGALLVERLREGRHDLVVRRALTQNGTAYEPFERSVEVRHAATTTLKVTLLPKTSSAALAAAPGEEAARAWSVPAIATTSAGVAVVGAGVVCGVLSFLDAREVEKRAADQQLVFPRDEALVQRGTTFAIVADVLYGVGAAVVAGGIGLWFVSSSADAAAEEKP